MTDERMKLADRIDAWEPGKGVLVFIARERRMISDALRAPEAVDAGAVAFLDKKVTFSEDWSAEPTLREHVTAYYRENLDDKDVERAVQMYLAGVASPTAAGIAASPETKAELWYIHYDGFCGHYKSNEPKGHVALCYDEDFADRIMTMLDAATSAVAADAVRAVVRDLQEQADFAFKRQEKEYARKCQQGDRSGEIWHARQEAFIEAKLRLERALSAPVDGERAE